MFTLILLFSTVLSLQNLFRCDQLNEFYMGSTESNIYIVKIYQLIKSFEIHFKEKLDLTLLFFIFVLTFIPRLLFPEIPLKLFRKGWFTNTCNAIFFSTNFKTWYVPDPHQKP